MLFIVEVDNDGFKVYNSSGTLIDPATDAVVQAVRDRIGEVQAAPTQYTLLDRLREINLVSGIKKIVDALPIGDNWIGRIKIGDGTNVAATPNDGASLATAYGFPVLGKDAEDKARFLLVEGDGTLKVASQPPAPPPGTTEFALSQPEANLEISQADSPADTESAVIGSGLNLYLQSLSGGAAGDPSERGSRVDVLWREGAGPTDHVVERIFVAGQSVSLVLPNVNKARDGTQLTGNGTNTKLVIRRVRLSNSDQEVDAEVRGYTE